MSPLPYDASASSIEKSANIKSPELIEHPVAIGYRAEVHIGSSIGAFSFINIDTIIYRNTKVGRYCSFARGCEIGAANHPTTMLSTHSFQYSNWMFPKIEEYGFNRKTRFLDHPDTIIGSDVWVGAQCVIRAGVTVGDGAIIAANAVVTKHVPPYAIVGGSPAKLIRYRFEPEVIERLLLAKWWNKSIEELTDLPFDDINACLSALGYPARPSAVKRAWNKVLSIFG